ncbi:MAG: right-handed parallel beta-helix repeat-containing protein [Phycisphaeraceae bacterium]
MLRHVPLCILLLAAPAASAATLRVPQDHKSVQAAVDAASSGDTVLVSAGRYPERLTLRAGITVRSEGDDTKGTVGLKRAEAAILDGGGKAGEQPGIVMAEGSTLDGFTVTNVGVYDDDLWKKHHATHGEELGDDEGAVQAEGTTAAVSIKGVNCTVSNCIVHHNGDVGIGVIGKADRAISPVIEGNTSYRNLGGGIGVADHAQAIVRGNTCYENLRAGIGCRNASPLILDNVCHHNVRAGIGNREKARSVIRGNKCYLNRRAGIGIRMEGTAPIVEHNECYENDMAGIGCRDGASPIIRDNKCLKNKMAGIGCDGASPQIIGNDCRENAMSGIGLRGKGSATVANNTCVENQLVAIGVTDGSTALITGNRLSRTGGMPPLIAIKDGSIATVLKNTLEGGGVAAVLVQGNATISGNTFKGVGDKQGNAVWVWEGSDVTVHANTFNGYRAAVNASKAKVIITANSISGFSGAAIIVRDSSAPANVHGNTAVSSDAKARVIDLLGALGVVGENVIRQEAAQSPK